MSSSLRGQTEVTTCWDTLRVLTMSLMQIICLPNSSAIQEPEQNLSPGLRFGLKRTVERSLWVWNEVLLQAEEFKYLCSAVMWTLVGWTLVGWTLVGINTKTENFVGIAEQYFLVS